MPCCHVSRKVGVTGQLVVTFYYRVIVTVCVSLGGGSGGGHGQYLPPKRPMKHLSSGPVV
eukprot:jgi/Botrbrau1/19672/Bobra.0003s0034.1